jgi:hypothetical protein
MGVSKWAGTFLAAAVAAVLLSEAAPAQLVPYRSSGSYGWGPYPSASASYIDRGVMAAQQGADRRQALATNARRHENMNQYLMGQAQRNSAWAGQNQAMTQQLRLQEMQRQNAQTAALARLPAPAAGTSPPPAGLALPSAAATAPAQPPASSGGGQWPSLLSDPRFAEPRAELAKLLAAEQATEARLTSQEYQEIVAAAARMKEILRGMAGELNAAEYLMVSDFLDKLMATYRAKAEPTQ